MAAACNKSSTPTTTGTPSFTAKDLTTTLVPAAPQTVCLKSGGGSGEFFVASVDNNCGTINYRVSLTTIVNQAPTNLTGQPWQTYGMTGYSVHCAAT